MKKTLGQPYLKIGEVARLVGVSPSVIRTWEGLGLTRPAAHRQQYRLYSAEDDVKLLKRARFLRRVRGHERSRDCADVEAGWPRPSAASTRRRDHRPASAPLAHRKRSLVGAVAKKVGISVGFLSSLERSQMTASIGTLRKLTDFYQTNILDFFDPTESNSRLVPPAKRKVLDAGPGVRMELLAWGNTVMEPHLFRIAPQADSGERYTHEGEEFIYVLEGRWISRWTMSTIG